MGGAEQILRQFGELAPELADMQKYAAWKAADISIALREGRTPTPGNGNAAASDLSLPGVPTHTGEATPPQVLPLVHNVTDGIAYELNGILPPMHNTCDQNSVWFVAQILL